MELLTNSGTERGWNPSITMEAVLLTIKQLMIDGGGRVISNGAYSEMEAKNAFNRVASQHGWIKGDSRYYKNNTITQPRRNKLRFIVTLVIVCLLVAIYFLFWRFFK
eukprot:TRINITY_DN1265_c0_g1_i2.p1 TRINITY_DN1265_c0_g1~~TRINITY_DN1265_c0_g1_i2.p1  ORF type:complete len:107 (+),score=7.62 TRINITY_DN1265_c0_g1_i2:401-721(+)